MKRISLCFIGFALLVASVGKANFIEQSSYNEESLKIVINIEEEDDDWEDVTILSLDLENNI